MIESAGEGPAVSSPVASLLADESLAGNRVVVDEPRVIYDTESPARAMYFLESGQIRIFQKGPQGEERLSDILGPGAWFGTAALAGQQTHGSRAQVISPSVIWALDLSRLTRWLEGKPQVAIDMLRQLASRLKSCQAAAARLVFEDCNMRLVRTLLEFSRTAAAIPAEQGVVLRITHQELAEAVGAARETISLALTQLRRQNLLRTGRNRLTFDPQALRDFSEKRAPREAQERPAEEQTSEGDH
jgi:CRP/FNR family transcriptional regulator